MPHPAATFLKRTAVGGVGVGEPVFSKLTVGYTTESFDGSTRRTSITVQERGPLSNIADLRELVEKTANRSNGFITSWSQLYVEYFRDSAYAFFDEAYANVGTRLVFNWQDNDNPSITFPFEVAAPDAGNLEGGGIEVSEFNDLIEEQEDLLIALGYDDVSLFVVELIVDGEVRRSVRPGADFDPVEPGPTDNPSGDPDDSGVI